MPSTNRKSLGVALVIVAALVGSGWMIGRGGSEGGFFAFLDRNPSVARIVRPLFVAVGKSDKFDGELIVAEINRSLREIYAEDGTTTQFQPVRTDGETIMKSPWTSFPATPVMPTRRQDSPQGSDLFEQ